MPDGHPLSLGDRRARARIPEVSAVIGAVILALFAAASLEAQAAGPRPADIRVALRRYARVEPPVSAVVAAALRARTADGSVDDLAGWAQASGLVPTLRVTGRRGQALDLSAFRTSEADRTTLSSDDELSLEVSLTFPLDRLVYHPDELAIAREQRAEDDRRMEVIRTIVLLYFERRRLVLERDLVGRRDLATLVRIAEIDGLLDAFTDGAWSRMMIDRR